MKGSKSFDSTRPRRQAGSSGSLHPGPLPQGYPFSASHRPGVGTDAAVSQSRQRLECGDLSPLFSASASQLAADSPVPRAKAPTSWRIPNAAATAKPAVSPPTCRVRNALNTCSATRRPELWRATLGRGRPTGSYCYSQTIRRVAGRHRRGACATKNGFSNRV